MINSSNVYNRQADMQLTERFATKSDGAYVRSALCHSSVVKPARQSFSISQSFMAVLGQRRRIFDTAS